MNEVEVVYHQCRTLVDIVYVPKEIHVDAEIKRCSVCEITNQIGFPDDMPSPLQCGVRQAKTDSPQQAVKMWMETNRVGCRMLANINSEMKSIAKFDFATLTVTISEVYLLGRSAESP